MRIQLQDTLLQIDFHKEHRIQGTKDLIDTLCVIYEISGGDKHPAVQCRAKQNPMDKYSKIVGKKIALQKAIDDKWSRVDLIDGEPVRTCIGPFKTKESRTLLWNTFHDTFKRWR